MAEPIGNEIPSPSAVRLPGLGAPELSVDYLRKLQEIVESLLGRRGSTWDRAVTFRDLQAGGLGGFIPGAGFAVPALFNPGSGTITTPGGAFDIDAAIRESAAYKDLLTKIGSAEELANLPEQIRRQLEEALIDVARENGAAIRQSENKLHNEQVSLAWRLDEITASLNTAAAGVREYNAAFADDVKAVATRVEQVAADLAAGGGGVEVQEQLTAISDAVDGLKGQWSLKIQTNPTSGQPPVIAGISLAVEDPIAGPGTSALVFMAEKFAFFTNNGAKQLVTLENDEIVLNAAVKARSLRVGSPDNIMPDPRFKDLTWWGVAGQNVAVGDWQGSQTFWRDHASMYLYPIALTTSYSAWFPVEKGARYRLESQIYLPDQFAGQFSVYLHVENVSYDHMGQPYLYQWAHTGLGVQHDSNSPRGARSFNMPEYVIPDHCTGRAQFVIIRKVDAGWVEIGGLRITRVADGSLVGDGVLEARHIIGDTLDVLAAKLGMIELGAGGALRQGQTAYDTGIGLFLGAKANGSAAMSMATNNGAKFLCDPENNVLKMVKAEIDGLTMPAFTATLSGPGFNSNGGNGTRVLGSRQITGNGGELPYRSISWTITDLEGNSAARTIISGDATDTVTVTASGTNAVTNVRIRGTITDAIGRTASASFSSIASFGTV